MDSSRLRGDGIHPVRAVVVVVVVREAANMIVGRISAQFGKSISECEPAGFHTPREKLCNLA